MTTEIIISLFGAGTALIVSFIGAFLANRNSITLQTRKLKEEHYITFIEALHNLAAHNGNQFSLEKVAFSRDRMLIIASEDVIKKLLIFEDEAMGKTASVHDVLLTDIIKAIRKDLKLKDKDFPKIGFKK
jgi:hypothetical protein